MNELYLCYPSCVSLIMEREISCKIISFPTELPKEVYEKSELELP